MNGRACSRGGAGSTARRYRSGGPRAPHATWAPRPLANSADLGQHPATFRALAGEEGMRRSVAAAIGIPFHHRTSSISAAPRPSAHEIGMSSLFKPSSNTAFRIALFVLALVLGGGLVAGPMIYVRTPYFTQLQDPIDQPVQFDHRHHVGDEGIDCRYCHALVEKAPNAGVPPTSLCLNCHEQIWNKSPKLAPVREARS